MRFLSPLASVLFLALAGCGTHPAPRAEPADSEVPAGSSEAYEPPPSAFDGDAEELRATDMVPTLDTPLRPGRSAVWCAGVPATWKALEREVTHGPVKIEGGLPEADRLNAAPDPTGDIRPECLFTAAGFVSDGIVDRIMRGMNAKFPNKTLPDFSDLPPESILAYGYLDAEVTFTSMYDVLIEPLVFRGVDGTKVSTQAFGYRRTDGSVLHGKTKILYCTRVFGSVTDCAVELESDPSVDQVVVAYADGKGTLEEIYDRVQRKIRRSRSGGEMHGIDSLEVPPVVFSVVERMPEFLGRNLVLPGGVRAEIDRFTATLKFRLDRKGAHVEEEAFILSPFEVEPSKPPEPRDFRFDRPFLLYMKKRGAERPYFVMWVANAELLCKWPAAEK
jgi:hypothetical protein